VIDIKIENKITIYNIPDRVICQICGGTFRVITETHLAKHELNMKEYRKMFPNVEVFCADSRRKCSRKMSDWLKNPEHRHTPPSRLKEYRKNKIFMKKSQHYNALVQRLPYRKKQLSKHFKRISNNEDNKQKHIEKLKELKIKRVKKYMPKIKKLLNEGVSVKEIEKEIGFSDSTIYNWLNEEKLVESDMICLRNMKIVGRMNIYVGVE